MVKTKMHRKKVMIGGFLLLIVLASAYGGYMLFSQWKKTNDEQQKIVSGTNAILKSGTNEAEQLKVFEQYGSTYDEYVAQLEESDPMKWDRIMVDKAYFVLVYADKSDLFNDVFNVYELMQRASAAGVNIDKNDYNMNQQSRDDMLNRAKALQATPTTDEEAL